MPTSDICAVQTKRAQTTPVKDSRGGLAVSTPHQEGSPSQKWLSSAVKSQEVSVIESDTRPIQARRSDSVLVVTPLGKTKGSCSTPQLSTTDHFGKNDSIFCSS